MNEELKLPFYAKATIFILGLVALFLVLYIARGIIVPLVFATILAVLLHPVVNFFVRIRINRIIAIAITLIITFLFLAGFSALLISQVSRFTDFWPVLVDKFTLIINQTISDGADYFQKDPQKIHAWIAKTQGEILNSSAAGIGHTLKMIGGGLVVVLLLPVYIFLILFYQPLLIEFIHRLFGKDNHNQVSEIVSKIKTVIQRHLSGLVIEAAIIAALDTSALMLLGIDYALLLGIIGALLNVIPYVGGLVAVSLPMLVAIATKSSPLYALYVLAAYYFIQLIDNNYIVPYIVASKVKINALFSIIAVLAGNALWGIPGMFLAIPLLAVVKLIFDHIEPLKAWGFLLGDTMPGMIAINTIFKKVKSK
jgi:predicted PurR-regulated permease PerM